MLYIGVPKSFVHDQANLRKKHYAIPLAVFPLGLSNDVKILEGMLLPIYQQKVNTRWVNLWKIYLKEYINKYTISIFLYFKLFQLWNTYT